MKIITTFFLATTLCISTLLSGQTINNGNLEAWQQSGSGLYSNPTGGFWATLNPLADLTGPVTVERVTDACEGEFAAKLTSKNFTSLLLSGLLYSGEFNPINLTNPTAFGKPFTLRPVKFKGCYKYAPVDNDTAAVVCILTRWNGSSRDTIATAGGETNLASATYNNFDYIFDYSSTENPDSIQIIFAASANSNDGGGSENSTLWIDNVAIDLTNNISLNAMPELVFTPYPNPTVNSTQITLPSIANAEFTVLNPTGAIVLKQTAQTGSNTISLNTLPAGLYTIVLSANGRGLAFSTLTKTN